VAELRPRLDELEKAGAQVAVIGTGWPAAAKGFAQALGLPPSLPVLCDRRRASFALLGLRRSVAATLLLPRVLKKWFALLRRGFRQTKVQGDPWQQGGAAVVGPRGGGELLYRYASKEPGDDPQLDDVLSAVREAALRSAS
jgi:hypothetical protein